VVADFGIARAMSTAGSERVTQAGMALGTPAYMSPEQAAGERDVDGRTDQYALASVLYEMLAGEPPFTGATMEAVLVQRFTRPAPRVSLKRPAVPRAVDAAINTAMSRAPEDRFASMARFIAGLDAKAAPDGELDRSIAVLPFANMSGDPDNEYFSDGISEEIINALTQLPGLRVAARTSAFSFKGRNVDLRTVGDQLDVATVLEGSVRKAGGRIRITAQLIKVADGYHLWSERYDRELTDVFAIQDEIAGAIAGRLKLTLGVGAEAPRGRSPTANVEAYDLYLKGRAFFKQRGPSLLRAVECFEQACALDPGLASAYTGLADALLLMALYGMATSGDIRDRARAATTRALELDPELPSAQVVLGLYYLFVDFDRTRSAESFQRAVILDPASVDARTIQAVLDYCYIRGDRRGAEALIETVIELDPLSANARAQAGIILTWSGKFREAMSQAARGIELDPGAFYPHWAHYMAQAAGPDPSQAVASGPALLTRFGRHPWLMMALAYAAGVTGNRERAQALYDELLARSRGEYVQPVSLAITALGAGRREETFTHLREAARIRDPLLAVTVLHWPLLDSIRGTAEFAEVLRIIGWG
jgi:serine/threonine-protein kinase